MDRRYELSIQRLIVQLRRVPRSPITTVIRHATIDLSLLERVSPNNRRISAGTGVVFEDCIFLGSISLGSLIFSHGLSLLRCEFKGDVTFLSLQVDRKFRIEQCQFGGDLRVPASVLPPDLKIIRSEFRGVFQLTIASAFQEEAANVQLTIDDILSRLRFDRCILFDDVALTVNSNIREIAWFDCHFSTSVDATITCGPAVNSVAFNRSVIEGRIVLEETNKTHDLVLRAAKQRVVWFVKPPISDTVRGRVLSLAKVVLQGHLEIEWRNTKCLKLIGASLQGGSLWIPLDQLRLEYEARPQNIELTSLDRDPTILRRYGEMGDQYQRLCDLFAAMPLGDRHGDVCMYRSFVYRRMMAEAEFGHHRFGLAWLLLLCFVLVLCSAALQLERGWGTQAIIVLFGTTCVSTLIVLGPSPRQLIDDFRLLKTQPAKFPQAILSHFQRVPSRIGKISSLLWEWYVLDQLLGYGVRIKSILLKTLIFICACGMMYGFGSMFFPQNGEVLDRCNTNFMTGDPGQGVKSDSTCQGSTRPKSLAEYSWRAIYFSVLRFSNLGSDEYRPTGRLQVVATVESLGGIFLTTMLVALFGRRYLRL